MLTNVVSATIITGILVTNWLTVSVEKPYPSPAIPPHSFVLVTNILHQTGSIVSNTVAQVPYAGGTNTFSLHTNAAPGTPTQTTNQIKVVYTPDQF